MASTKNGFAMNVTDVHAKPGTLLHDMFELAVQDLVDPYAEYRRKKSSGKLWDLPDDERIALLPEWRQDYDESVKQTDIMFRELGLGKPDDRSSLNTFWLMCRDRFKVLERYHRVSKHLSVTPVPTLTASIKHVADTAHDQATPRKRKRIFKFDCSSEAPVRRAKKVPGKLSCWICGYSITQKKSIQFGCCDKGRVSHTLCWNSQSDSNTPVICANVKNYCKRNCRTPDQNVSFGNGVQTRSKQNKLQSLEKNLYCSSCDQMLDPNDENVKDHLKYACQGIPSTPLSSGYTKPQLARRMAAFGAKKKLYTHNFSPHKPPDRAPEPPSTDAVAGQSLT